MITNNFQRLHIWLSLQDKLSYEEYIQACAQNGCADICTNVAFAMKAGIAAAAIHKYPELPAGEAYMKYITAEAPKTAPCGSCGGGRVL